MDISENNMIPLSMIALFALFITQLAILVPMDWVVVIAMMVMGMGMVVVGMWVILSSKRG